MKTTLVPLLPQTHGGRQLLLQEPWEVPPGQGMVLAELSWKVLLG